MQPAHPARVAFEESVADQVRTEGWGATEPVIPAKDLDELTATLAPLAHADSGRGGVRNLFAVPLVRGLARSAPVRAVAEAVLGAECFAARGILFDKTPGANWKVVWHQDLTIMVRERVEVPGFGPWSEKAGVACVQPPVSLLERMVAVRVHLDDCGAENGPVRVLPRSHLAGRLSPAEIDAWKARVSPVDCLVARGGVLAFRPLLLHASSPATAPAHRRVIHLEFACEALPGGLVWHDRV